MRVITKLRMQRTLHNLSQTALGEKIGVSQTYINMIETQKAIPSREISNKLEDIFNIKIDELLSGANVEGGKS